MMSTFALSRHNGVTTLVLEKIPLPWLVIEEVTARTLLPHSLTWNLANRIMNAAHERRRVIWEQTLDEDEAAAIDPDWARMWAEHY